MPFSSRDLTSEASLNRGGGCVSCPSGSAETSSGASPSASWGADLLVGLLRPSAPRRATASARSSFSSVSASCPYTRRYPASFRTEPVARRRAVSGTPARVASTSTVVTSVDGRRSSARRRTGSRSGVELQLVGLEKRESGTLLTTPSAGGRARSGGSPRARPGRPSSDGNGAPRRERVGAVRRSDEFATATSASSAVRVESVRMYVMSPIVPAPRIVFPS